MTSVYDNSTKLKDKKDKVEKTLLYLPMSDELFILFDKMEVWDILFRSKTKSENKEIYISQKNLLNEVRTFIVKATEDRHLLTLTNTKDHVSYNTPEYIHMLTRALKSDLERQFRRHKMILNNIIFTFILLAAPPFIYLVFLILTVGSFIPEELFSEFKSQLFAFSLLIRRLIAVGVFLLAAYIGLKTYDYFHLLYFGDHSQSQQSKRERFSYICFIIGFTIFALLSILFIVILSHPIF